MNCNMIKLILIFTLIFFYILMYLSQITFSQDSKFYKYKYVYPWMTEEKYIAIYNAHFIYNISINEICAIIHSESNGVPTATSSVGARGLMQVMPLHIKNTDPNKLYSIQFNVFKGTEIWKECKQRSKGNLILAIIYYNGGPAYPISKYRNWNYANEIIMNIIKTQGV